MQRLLQLDIDLSDRILILFNIIELLINMIKYDMISYHIIFY